MRMHYIAVEWLHSNPTEPSELYYELDDERYEHRKIEVFSGGRIQYADASHQTDSTWLAIDPHPSVAEIAADPEFRIKEIGKSQFEYIWDMALKRGS